jgi:hypothetical protein
MYTEAFADAIQGKGSSSNRSGQALHPKRYDWLRFGPQTTDNELAMDAILK